MRKRTIIVRHGEVHAVDQEEMHIDKHNPYQNFKSMSGLPCMLSKSSIRHVINVLDILSHTDWFQVVCRPRESCQHQTRAGFLWGGDNGLLEGLGGLPRVRGGSQQSHIYLLSIAFVNMDPLVHLGSPLSSLSWRVYALRTIFLPWAEGRSQFQSLVWCRLQKWVWIWSTNESSVKLHTNCCQGEVVFILSLFEDCVRGQHVCLADAERSSSQPITNEYWGYVWLSLALITNYVRLYSWKWVKILLRPFWSHFTYPQSRILSPISFVNMFNIQIQICLII